MQQGTSNLGGCWCALMITYQHKWLKTKEDAQMDLIDLLLKRREAQAEDVKVRSSLGCSDCEMRVQDLKRRERSRVESQP